MGLAVDSRYDLLAWQTHFQALGVVHTPVIDHEYGSVLTFKDPDRIQFELFFLDPDYPATLPAGRPDPGERSRDSGAATCRITPAAVSIGPRVQRAAEAVRSTPSSVAARPTWRRLVTPSFPRTRGHVVVDRLGRDDEPIGDLHVGEALGKQRGHIELARGEPRRVRPGARPWTAGHIASAEVAQPPGGHPLRAGPSAKRGEDLMCGADVVDVVAVGQGVGRLIRAAPRLPEAGQSRPVPGADQDGGLVEIARRLPVDARAAGHQRQLALDEGVEQRLVLPRRLDMRDGGRPIADEPRGFRLARCAWAR